MPEQDAFWWMLLAIFFFTLALSQILAKIMHYCLLSAGDILEKPENLWRYHRRRKISLFGLLFPLYSLSYYIVTDALPLFILWIFITFMVFISIMDFEQQVILDKVLFLLLLFALLFSNFLPAVFLDRLGAAITGGVFFFFLAVVTKGGIGGGDIKLIFVLGLWLGSEKLIFTVLTGCISSGLISMILLLAKIKKPQDSIAYGPYFAFSAIMALLFNYI